TAMETIRSISIEHSVCKRNWATYRLPANVLLPRIGLSIAVEVSVVVCKKATSRNSGAPDIRQRLRLRLLRFSALVAGVSLLAAPLRSQTQLPEWQAEVRKYAEARDWISAMRIVDREAAAAPQDMDVRAWRARVLGWSGRLPEAEKEYLEILRFGRNDPDDWMGLAGVYSREGKSEDALRALSRAVELDPQRADLHAARARALRAEGERIEARMEFQ